MANRRYNRDQSRLITRVTFETNASHANKGSGDDTLLIVRLYNGAGQLASWRPFVKLWFVAKNTVDTSAADMALPNIAGASVDIPTSIQTIAEEGSPPYYTLAANSSGEVQISFDAPANAHLIAVRPCDDSPVWVSEQYLASDAPTLTMAEHEAYAVLGSYESDVR